jgi:K+-sensing histidine kinase KdpD
MSKELYEAKESRQFAILRDIVISASSGQKSSAIAGLALSEASGLVGLSAACLILWDENNTPILTVAHSETEQEKKILFELEEELFVSLRKNNRLVSAYMSFGGEMPLSSFTMPLRSGEKILGAVIGIQKGKSSLVSEDIFLETLSAALSLAMAADAQLSPENLATLIKRERLNAITETVATVSHEINNPLTAVLGNVQLLLMKGEGLNDDIARKLKVIEESALRIRDVTQKLMNITRDKVTDYSNGVKMIDLNEEDTSSS